MKTLLVFSHLRWNFVFQRPQHLLTRLAAHYRVLFVEEPMHDSGHSRTCPGPANASASSNAKRQRPFRDCQRDLRNCGRG
jgi:hypothetical protein